MANARDPITYEQVVAAIAAIEAAGDKLTMRRLQSEVGGSNTTVLAHMRRWQQSQRAAAAMGPEDGILPTELRAAMGAWVQQRETAARQEAETQAAQAEELYLAAKEGWEQADLSAEALQKELAAQKVAGTEQEKAAAQQASAHKASSEAAQKQVAELKEQVAREQHNAETSRVAAAEARIKADAAAESIQTLGKANEELRSELRAQSSALSEAQQRAAVAEERAKSRDEQLVELRGRAKADMADLHQRLKDAEESIKSGATQLADAQRAAHEKSQAAEVLQVRLSESEARGKAYGEQLAQARAEAEQRAKAAEALRERLDAAQAELGAAQRDLAICREQRQRGGRGGQDGGSDSGSPGTDDSEAPELRKAGPGKGPSHKSQNAETATSLDAGQAEVNVTMRKLGKPSTPQEVKRSMEALLTCAPKLGHELHRGQAPKTREHAADRGGAR